MCWSWKIGRSALTVISLLWLVELVEPPELAAAGDPTVEWRTLQTAHFRIHFPLGSRSMALRLATIAEETHQALTPFMGTTVEDPVDVVLIDTVDTANGSARTIPYNLITVYTMAPESDSTLSDTDDWLRNLFVHEYTHILHTNDTSGISAIINAVLGKKLAPNHALPRWYLEGLAIYNETAFTEGGRLRNSAYRMYLRMDALDGRFRGPENLGGYPIEWPAATGWYLYGSDFMNYVARIHGPQRWIEFNRSIGGALSPLAVNQTSTEIFGLDLLALWGRYSAASHGQFTAQAVAVAAAGETPVSLLTTGAHLNGYPRCQGPHALGFVRDDGRSERQIVRHDLVSGRTEPVMRVYGNGSFDWSPDGRFLVYTETSRYRHYYAYNDLYLLDTRTGSTRRLTVGARAREPAFSPDGRQVAYVAANQEGGVDLMELSLDTGQVSMLLAATDGQLASTPVYSPDGRMVAVSLWQPGWGRDLYLVHRTTGELERLTEDRAQDLSPSYTPDGQGLLFASDRTGIYNIYRLDLPSRQVTQLTNVMGGLFSPQQCATGGPIFVRSYGSQGYDIGVIDRIHPRAAPPSYDRPQQEYPDLPPEQVVVSERTYNPYVTLYPRSWSPIISQDGDATLLLGASVAGSDPLYRHLYTAEVNYGLDSEHLNLGFRYSYTRLPVDIHLFLSRSESSNLYSLVAETRRIPFEEEWLSAGLTLSLPLTDERSGHSLYMSYALRDVQPLSMPEIHHDPGDIQPSFPEFGRFDDLSFGWSWGNARGFAYSVSAEEGTQLTVHLGLSSPLVGADFDRVVLGWGLRQYFPVPYLDGHLVALLITGAIGRSSLSRRALYGVGGFPDQDLLLSVIENTPIGAGFLRGYRPNVQVGSQYHVLNLEYRLPLWNIDTGIYTLPIFFERLFLAAFVDCGTALDRLSGFDTLRTGVGAELRLKGWLSYVVPADFRLGFARGLTHEGINQLYVLYGGTF